MSGRDQDDLNKDKTMKTKYVSLSSKHKDMNVKVALDLLDFDESNEDHKSNFDLYIES